MKDYRAKRMMSLAALIATTGVFVLVLTAPAQAQRGNPIDVFNAERARQREEDEHRRRLEHIKDEGFKKPGVTDPRLRMALMAQIKEDFTQIQVLNNEMIRVAFTEQSPDYERLSSKAADVKRRAARLRESIKFYEIKDEKRNQIYQDAVNSKQLKESLLMLRNLINRFVNSPLFQKPGVLDVQRSVQTSRDLRDIIELSDSIKRSAKKLDKAP